MDRIGIVGAGQMGAGIAQIVAQHGMAAVLLDVSQAALDSGLATIDANLAKQAQKGRLTDDGRRDILARIEPTTDYAAFAQADLVIEAATEDEETKRGIYRLLCPHLKPDAFVATNTSSLSITRMAAATDRAERFVGMHFMNPVPRMPLVEIIRGIQTGDAAFEACKALAERLGKTVTVSEDFPAFIVNRILMPMINEAVYTLYAGVGSVANIDQALKLGANHPMGPLELADFIGLDTCLSIMNVLYEGLADTKYRPCPLLVKYVEAGWLGRKAGRGFYDYAGEVPVPTR